MKMKTNHTKALILIVIAIIWLVAGIYGMTRPLAYGYDYYHAVFYEGEDFNGTMTFYSDNTMVIRNTNFEEDIKLFYYYKNGYVFFGMSQTESEYHGVVRIKSHSSIKVFTIIENCVIIVASIG